MNRTTRFKAFGGVPRLLLGFVMPLLVTLGLWMTSRHEISLAQFLSAWMLLCMPCWSYDTWKRSSRAALPLFALIASIYWLYFALPLFWGDRLALDWRSGGRILGNDAVTTSLLMVLAGLTFLWLGMRSGISRVLVLSRLPDIPHSLSSMTYLRCLLVAGSALSLFSGASSAAGEGGRQIIYILQSDVPLVVFAFIFRRYLTDGAGLTDKILMAGFVILRVVTGISSGWLGSLVTFALVLTLVWLGERRRLPLAVFALLVPYVLFFQAGKTQFREQFWQRQADAGHIEKVEFWFRASAEAWSDAFSDPTKTRVGDLLSRSLMRTSLLTQSANVVEQTPSVVPYQYGRLYSYLGVTLIPRFLWPDKPSVNEANRFYQVAYGVTNERYLDTVSIAMGALTESYVNFGWFGVAGVMFILGLLLDLFQRYFLAPSSGALLRANHRGANGPISGRIGTACCAGFPGLLVAHYATTQARSRAAKPSDSCDWCFVWGGLMVARASEACGS